MCQLFVLCGACGAGKTTVKEQVALMLPEVFCADVDQLGLNWWDYAGTPREAQYTHDCLMRALQLAGTKPLLFACCNDPGSFRSMQGLPAAEEEICMIGLTCSDESIAARLLARPPEAQCGSEDFIRCQQQYNRWIAAHGALFDNVIDDTDQQAAETAAAVCRIMTDRLRSRKQVAPPDFCSTVTKSSQISCFHDFSLSPHCDIIKGHCFPKDQETERDNVIDKHLMEQMEGVLSRLHVPISVLDQDPAAHMCDELPLHELNEGVAQPVANRLCMMIRRPSAVLCCPIDAPNAEDMLQLAAALIASMATGVNRTESSADVYRRALLGELSGTELEALSHEHQMPCDLDRCVMVFHMVQTDQQRAYDLMDELTPLQDRDVLIDMDRHTVALIKDLSDEESVDELIQYGQALQETLISETARQITVGIGRSCRTLDELHDSYSEAMRAMEVGRVFQPDATIFAYSRLILERFLMEMPPEISAQYHNMLFNRRTMRLFNEEMLYTIDMFFKKDLNLSDTARQLYIHRNTLVYRLDKVQRQTGLDLRSFEDAVTFKILMELKNCCGKK